MWFQSLEVKLMPGDTGSCCISSLKSSRWWSMFAVYGGNRFMNPSIRRNWLPRIQKNQDWLCVSPVLLRKGGSFPPWTEVTHHWTLVKLQPNYVWDLSSALILSHLTLVTLLKTWPEHSEEVQSPHRTDLRKRNKYGEIWSLGSSSIYLNLHISSCSKWWFKLFVSSSSSEPKLLLRTKCGTPFRIDWSAKSPIFLGDWFPLFLEKNAQFRGWNNHVFWLDSRVFCMNSQVRFRVFCWFNCHYLWTL